MNRQIINFIDAKMEDLRDRDQPNAMKKALGLGVVEGLMDVVTAFGMVCIVAKCIGFVTKKK